MPADLRRFLAPGLFAFREGNRKILRGFIMATVMQPVQFHGDTIFCVEQNG